MNDIKKREESKFLFNALDIAFVLFIIAVVVFAAIRSDFLSDITIPYESCEIELTAENLDVLINDSYNDKDIFLKSGTKLGTVTSSKLYTGNDEVGSSSVSLSGTDKKSTLTLTVSADLKCKDGKYYSADGDLIISGADFVLHGKTFSLNCVVKSVNSVKK